MAKFTIKAAPFMHTREDVKTIMWTVIIALMPATLWSLYLYKFRALSVILVTVIFTQIFEWIFLKIRGINNISSQAFDGSALLTGLLLALNLPSTTPWWVCIIGAFIAMIFGKHLYGGIGNNPFNPALVARVFLLLSFPTIMTTWTVGLRPDVITAATPLGILKTEGVQALQSIDMLKLFIGLPIDGVGGGSIGEISELALLLGGIFLIVRKIIKPIIPVIYILTVFIFTGIMYMVNPNTYMSPIFHMVTGGLFLGAFFMATDMVTTPITNKGKIIFALGCGIITSLIRLFGSYPEGVSFSILIMNALTPTIDKYTKNKKFGG